jgi:hypothetical protein
VRASKKLAKYFPNFKRNYHKTNSNTTTNYTYYPPVCTSYISEEPPENEQEMLIYADFNDSAGLKRAPFFHISTIVINVLSMRYCKRLLATLDMGVGTYSEVFFLLVNYFFCLP